jgi:integrase
MRTLHQAIQAHAKGAAPALMKYLNECGLNDWEDLTKVGLNDFRDYVTERVASSSAKTYFAVFKAILKRYEDDVNFCKDYKEILKANGKRPLKTFLTLKELERLERVEVKSDQEQLVLDEFLIGAFTGMRISDARVVTEENMMNGSISYVSIKTGIHAVVPMKEGIAERIRRVQTNECTISTMGFNKAIRRLAQRAGITERVTVYKAGETLKGEKWQFLSSHAGRISFATNLSLLGVPLMDIKQLMGHSDVSMTIRYIVPTQVELSNKALKYFQ